MNVFGKLLAGAVLLTSFSGNTVPPEPTTPDLPVNISYAESRVAPVIAYLSTEYSVHIPVVNVILPPPPPQVVKTVRRAPRAASSGSSSGSGYAWTTYVANSGGQEAIDACAGGVTNYGNYGQFTYFPIHVHCGGSPILSLSVGSQVRISGGSYDGVYTVLSTKDVPKGATTAEFDGMGGSIMLQTCYRSGGMMRLVSIG